MPRPIGLAAATLSLLAAATLSLLATVPPPAASAPQFATRVLALEDYYRLVRVGRPAVSPDGRQVAFERTVVIEEENRRHTEIWLVDRAAASDPRRLTSPRHDSRQPRWSPDGRLLSFVSSRGGEGGDIWFLDLAEGGEAYQIEGVSERPIFSPDGAWIAFTKATPPTGRAALQTRSGRGRYDLDSEQQELIESRFSGRVFDWMWYRFDGSGYLPDRRDPLAEPPWELYVVPARGGQPRRLTRLGVDVTYEAWGPGSDKIYFAADEQQRDEHSYAHVDLWVADLNGEVTRLTDDGFNNRSPTIAPDRSSLVFHRVEGNDRIIADGRDRGATRDLYRLALDGSGTMTNLTASWDLRPSPPRIDSRGEYVWFDAVVDGQQHLFRVALAGGPVEQVTEGERWLSAFDFDAAFSTAAYVGETSGRPGELYSLRLSDRQETRLTRSNDALAATVQFVGARRQQVIGTDGTPIDAWIMLPPGSGDTGYPLVLSIHGGPHSAYGERFAFSFQLWTAAGYAVLYANPRGSTGYGEDFLWSTWGGWGNRDFEDVMAALDHALERWPVDPNRLGVTGYSYGGFLTNWAITQTDRFAAAISGAGISNWISDYGTSDVPQTKETEFFGPPWEERSAALMWEQSPIRHADGVTTPTLFLHGEADYRVPIEQSEQMYMALRKQRVAARFVRYPETGHGGWRPWDAVHKYYQELQWWERYLGEE